MPLTDAAFQPVQKAFAGSGIGSAAGLSSGGVMGTLAGLAAHPLWGSLMAMGGYRILEGILSPKTPYERAAERQMQAGLSVIPELQKQARGEPTAASRAVVQQVRQEGQRQQQSYATSARKAGMLGSTPGGQPSYRAETGRIQSDVRQVMGQRLGQAQLAAQQQLAGFLQPGIQSTERQDIYRDVQEEKTLAGIGRWMQRYYDNKGDPRWEEMKNFLMELAQGGTTAKTTNPYPSIGGTAR